MQWRASSLVVFLAYACLTVSARADLFQLSGGAIPGCAGTGCPATAPVLSINQAQAPDNFSFNFTDNGDQYTASGAEYATYTSGGGTVFIVDMNVVYTGLSSTQVADSFGINVFQDFFNTSQGSWDGSYTLDTGVTLSPGVGPNSSVSVDVYYNGGSSTEDVGLLGPYTTTQGYTYEDKNLTGLGSGSTLAGEFVFNYSFAAGTQHGAGVSFTAPTIISPTPEPREALPVIVVLIAGATYTWKRRRSTMVPLSIRKAL